MPDTKPANEEPLLPGAAPTKKRTVADIWDRTRALELCGALAGLAGTVAVVVTVARDPRELLALVFLPLTVPLFLFPLVRWLLRVWLPDLGPAPAWAWLTRADLALSSASLLAALAASWGALIADAARNPELPGYQPTQWPVDAFYFVSLSFASAAVRGRSPNSWYELATATLGVAAAAMMLLATRSYTSDWYAGPDWVERVYAGETRPFPNVTRIAHAANFPREGFYLRLGCAAACALLEGLACACRLLRFALTKCGTEHRRRNELWRDLRVSCTSVRSCGGLGEAAQRLAAWAVVVFILAQLALSALPYPRWVAYDSKHAALLAALAWGVAPQERMRRWWEGLPLAGLYLAGVAASTWATARTCDLFLRTLAATDELARRRDPAAPARASLWDLGGYEREIQMGRDSFLDVYQYARFDARTVPRVFAVATVYTLAVDWALCAVGAAHLGLLLAGLAQAFLDRDALTTPDGPGGGRAKQAV